MGQKQRTYIAIDLKSFFASVECADRHLDPLTTNLVVADENRTEKTICLAVSPSLKSYGIPGRPRLFEVVSRVRQVNAQRQEKLRKEGRTFSGEETDNTKVLSDETKAVGYITAPPRMARYMEVSAQVYQIYLQYIAAEDIHVYSIDEVFMDVTGYLKNYGMTPRQLAEKMIHEVLRRTGITATAGIGTNLYLCKVAMDIVAKHMPADQHGVRIASLDEMSYRRSLWTHTPLTDFWRVGSGTARKLEEHGIFTMGDIARASLGGAGDYPNEDLLYKLLGVNAQLLIDHAWGWEPCTIARIHAYKPKTTSLSSGQVLPCPYTFEKAKMIVREMTDGLVLHLVDHKVVTDQVVLTVGYDVENITDPKRRSSYHGPVVTDRYGRKTPKDAHGTENLGEYTSSSSRIIEAMMRLYDRIVDPSLLVRRMYVYANHLQDEEEERRKEQEENAYVQLDLFTDYEALEKEKREKEEKSKRERAMQEAILKIQKRYGKNALVRGTDLQEGATAMQRNGTIGGHKAQ